MPEPVQSSPKPKSPESYDCLARNTSATLIIAVATITIDHAIRTHSSARERRTTP